MIAPETWQTLRRQITGDLYTDDTVRTLFATDASAYREIPVAVAFPRTADDIRQLILFAGQNRLTLIPRSGGTSLAGQTVGNGLVVDVSKYMTRLLEVNAEERWALVEPGIVLDELNRQLAPGGLFFAPETSTSNRCTIGGMVGNNSCGSHALIYGSTRDHILEVYGLLSSGETVTFGPEDRETFEKLAGGESHAARIRRHLRDLFGNAANRQEIDRQFPDPEVRRRNNGYALDALCHTAPFEPDGAPFNLSRLIAGSEGTLLFLTAVKLHLEPRPAPVKLLSCVHLTHLEDAFEANLLALGHAPTAVELMDRTILECTRKNREQQANRFFVQGDPAALLIVEFTGHDAEALAMQAGRMEADLAAHGLGYSYVRVTGSDTAKVWALRKAGLGVLSNIPGDAKPVSLIEDTAVAPSKLAAYIRDLDEVMDRHGLTLVYHGHISTGELHLRPVLDLKRPEDVVKFRQVAVETARIVRKYRGSLSGEHGDGRLRGEFIPLMYGDTVYRWFRELKAVFDPDGIFNAGKITDTPAMDTHLRYVPGQPTRQIETIFDFSAEMGLMRAVEKCNGAGDCRKPQEQGGLMCPTYKALRDEWASTRGRANMLREVLTQSGRRNPFDDAELFRLMDTCLSCKGCKRECPSGIDMAKLKSEFLYHYYQSHRPSLRTRLIAGLSFWNRAASATRLGTALYNAVTQTALLKRALAIAPRRMPRLKPDALYRRLIRHTLVPSAAGHAAKSIWLGVDEVTHDYFPEVAAEAVRLLQHFGYHVVPVRYDSGRALISKGMLRTARKKAGKNVRRFAACVSADMPLVGLEPSCILSFSDEYPELVRKNLQEDARNLAKHTYTFDAFFMREVAAGHIPADAFHTREPLRIWVHGHCQQKALTGDKDLCAMLSLARGVQVEYIPSGCCGMAGSFGYEAEHYELSKQVGELVLFPTIRKAEAGDLIVAPGFSCRHHIEEGTGRKALHPVTCMLRLAALT